MEFLMKITIAISIVIAILIGYSQIDQEDSITPPIPIGETYWGRGQVQKDSQAIHPFKVIWI